MPITLKAIIERERGSKARLDSLRPGWLEALHNSNPYAFRAKILDIFSSLLMDEQYGELEWLLSLYGEEHYLLAYVMRMAPSINLPWFLSVVPIGHQHPLWAAILSNQYCPVWYFEALGEVKCARVRNTEWIVASPNLLSNPALVHCGVKRGHHIYRHHGVKAREVEEYLPLLF